MVKRHPYRIDYDRDVPGHLAEIDARHHRMIRREIDEQLTWEPTKEAKNRKPFVRPSAISPAWELRVGPENRFRVFYRVYAEDHAVLVVAVGEKVREKLYIGGKVVVL